MPTAEHRTRGRGARLRAVFTERLGYKGAALFFALVLWVVVRTEEPTEVIVPVRVVATYDDERALVGSLPAVRALVSGRAREVLKLFDSPPVLRRVIPPDAPDSVRLDLRPSDITRPPGIEISVIDVQPRTVILAFDVSARRQVPVVSRLQLTVDTSMRFLGEARLDPDSVTVTGRQSEVVSVYSVPTIAKSIVMRDTAQQQIPLDTTGLRVRVHPRTIRLRWYSRVARDGDATATRPLVDSTRSPP